MGQHWRHSPKNFRPYKIELLAVLQDSLAYTVRSTRILELLGWLPLAEIRMQHKAIMMNKIIHGFDPPYMTDIFREQLAQKSRTSDGLN